MDNEVTALLDDFSLLHIIGAQAAVFLQGQFTCDMRALKPGHAILGACCDHKGRILFNGWIGYVQENEFILLLPHSMLTAAQRHLQKFAVFSKVTLREQTGWTAMNYIGQETLPSLPVSDYIHAQLPLIDTHYHSLHWLIGSNETIAAILQALTPQTVLLKQNQQQYFTLLAHLVYIQPATCELFIPQMIGLEQLGGVSFNKGCYVGQEIVARTAYLGQLKRHLHSAWMNPAHPPPQPGDSLFNPEKEVVGQIAASSQDLLSSGYRLLVVIQDRALAGPLFDSQHQPVSLILRA